MLGPLVTIQIGKLSGSIFQLAGVASSSVHDPDCILISPVQSSKSGSSPSRLVSSVTRLGMAGVTSCSEFGVRHGRCRGF